MKQSRLRRRRVVRYALLYFLLFAVGIGLIVGPVVAGKRIDDNILASLGKAVSLGDRFYLMQPDLNHDNTNGTTQTGTGKDGYSGAYTATSTSSETPAASPT